MKVAIAELRVAKYETARDTKDSTSVAAARDPARV